MKQDTPCCAPEVSSDDNISEETKDPCCPPVKESSKECCSPKEVPKTSECCPPKDSQEACCPPAPDHQKTGYRIEAFVSGWQDTAVGEIPIISRKLNLADYRGRIAMRWGFGRETYTITPGLYAIGKPDIKSEVLVSANYKLSFDVLRNSIAGVSAWILVIDTKGVNVWCAAGKGTFGTDEIIRRVQMVDLKSLVKHRRLILPQLGAPGVSAHLVKKGCGFSVVYGPVRASDLPDFLNAGMQATPAMRRVSFTLLERTILTPVEISMLRWQILYVALALLFLAGIGNHIYSFSAAWTRGSAAIFTGMNGLLTGSVLTPILLPWLPGRAFSLKGVWTGAVFALLLCLSLFSGSGLLNQLALFLQVTAISSFTAMNFTGSSTYTSPSGVEKEMRIAIPCQLAAAGLAMILWLWSAF